VVTIGSCDEQAERTCRNQALTQACAVASPYEGDFDPDLSAVGGKLQTPPRELRVVSLTLEYRLPLWRMKVFKAYDRGFVVDCPNSPKVENG